MGRGRLRSLLGKGLLLVDEGSAGYSRPAFGTLRALTLCSSHLCKPLRPERETGKRDNEGRKETFVLSENILINKPFLSTTKTYNSCLTSNNKSVSCSVHSLPALAPLVLERHENNVRTKFQTTNWAILLQPIQLLLYLSIYAR